MNVLELKDLANKLMFDMESSEYETLLSEFDVILKQMDYIASIEGIEGIEPMYGPSIVSNCELREDDVIETITVKEALSNVKDEMANQVKVPKVVGISES